MLFSQVKTHLVSMRSNYSHIHDNLKIRMWWLYGLKFDIHKKNGNDNYMKMMQELRTFFWGQGECKWSLIYLCTDESLLVLCARPVIASHIWIVPSEAPTPTYCPSGLKGRRKRRKEGGIGQRRGGEKRLKEMIKGENNKSKILTWQMEKLIYLKHALDQSVLRLNPLRNKTLHELITLNIVLFV